MAEYITEENNPGLYASLLAQWNAERRPGWVVSGTKQYRVVQDATTKQVKFQPKGSEELYEHRSFR